MHAAMKNAAGCERSIQGPKSLCQIKCGELIHHEFNWSIVFSTSHYTTLYSIMNTAQLNGSAGPSASAGTSAQVVLGSMDRAEEYGSILTSLKSNGGSVQGEMVDRVLGGGEWIQGGGQGRSGCMKTVIVVMIALPQVSLIRRTG